MNLFKSTVLILALCIANPLCCCLELFSSETGSTGSSGAYSCCSQSSDAAESEKDLPEECSHQLTKSSQIMDGEIGFSLAKPLAFSSGHFAADLLEATVLRDVSASLPATDVTALHSLVGVSLAQAYCVWTL